MFPGKLAFAYFKENVLVDPPPEDAPLIAVAGPGLRVPLPITIMCAGTVTLIVELKRSIPNELTGNQSPAYNKNVVSSLMAVSFNPGTGESSAESSTPSYSKVRVAESPLATVLL